MQQRRETEKPQDDPMLRVWSRHKGRDRAQLPARRAKPAPEAKAKPTK